MELSFLLFLQHLHSPMLDGVMIWISRLGAGGVLWIVLGLVLAARPVTRQMGIRLLIVLVVALVIGGGLKHMIARPRPCWLDPSVPLLVPDPTDFSFPSGHALFAFTAAFSLRASGWRFWKSVALLAVLIAFSRLYLFVHYPSDILGGLLLGWAIVAVMARVPLRALAGLEARSNR